MTMPFRLQLAHAVTDALKSITPANGYTVDLSDFDASDGSPQSRVFRGRAWFGDSDALPMVSVLEGVNPGEELYEPPVDATSGEFDWPLLVQGFIDDDPINPTDPAYVLLRDVRRRLAVEKKRRKPENRSTDPFGAEAFAPVGCAVVGMSIGPGVVRPADDISARAYFWLNLTLRLVEDPEAA